MRFDLERSIHWQAEGNFVPKEAKEALPAQYAHFSTLGDFLQTLQTSPTKNQNLYQAVYDATWVGLCMSLDAENQRQLFNDLKGDPTQVQVYWSELSRTSSYPLYKKISQDPQELGYAISTIRSWQQDIVLPENWQEQPNSLYKPTTYYTQQLYPFIGNKNLREKAWEGHPYSYLQEGIFGSIVRIGDTDLLGYVGALKMLVGARTISLEKIWGEINKFDQARKGLLTISISDNETYLKSLYRRTQPYNYVAGELNFRITEREKELFGDTTPLATSLWRAVVFLRTSILPQAVSSQSVRGNLIELLVNRQYDQARYQFEELEAQYPGLVQDFVPSQLNIDPSTLRGLYQEESAKNIRPKTEADRKAEARQKVQHLINRQLVSADGKYKIFIKEDVQTKPTLPPSGPPVLFIKGPDWGTVTGRKFGSRISSETLADLVEQFGFHPVDPDQ